MAAPRFPEKALLLVGALFSYESVYYETLHLLEQAFGEAVMETPKVKWGPSLYYRDELGDEIYRRFVFFKDLIPQDALAPIKLATNEIENKFSENGKRKINLDPGYITPAKLVLASTKDYSHRIYLKDGIYAEVTLMFQNGCFVPHVNTYNDYKDEKFVRFFHVARNLLMFLKG
jgi:hypothetical protein